MATRGKGEGSVYKDETSGLWTVSIELPPRGGKRRRKVIRRKNKRDAVAALARLRSELEKSGDLRTSTMTVEQWANYWMRRVAIPNLRPNTVANYRNVLDKYILPAIGRTKLDKVTPASVRRVHDAVRDAGLSSTYALNAHRILSSCFEAALREGEVSRNPAKLVSAPRARASNLQVLDINEALQVLSVVADDPLGARWATSLLTGARRGEVIGLELDRVSDVLDISWQLQRIGWEHGCGATRVPNRHPRDAFSCGGSRGADCPERQIRVPDDYDFRHLAGGLYLTRPKSTAGLRLIPLVEPLASLMRAHIESAPTNPWGLVFSAPAWPLDPDQDSRNWRAVLRRAGIVKDVRLHDIRHTTVELLYAAGVDEDVIRQIVGHSKVAMTRSYRARPDLARVRAELEKMSDSFTRARSLEGTQ